MSRGKKLDIQIGASFDEGWSVVEEPKTQKPLLKSPKEHLLVFQKEKRKGKTITLVGEFFLEKNDAKALLKELKTALSCGGSYKNGRMEFQGEVKEKLVSALREKGFRLKNKS